MVILVYALAAYGVVFGIQQKLPFIRQAKFSDLWECPYCLGFWVGWVTWMLSWISFKNPIFAPTRAGLVPEIFAGLIWALAVAALCVLLESLTQGE